MQQHPNYFPKMAAINMRLIEVEKELKTKYGYTIKLRSEVINQDLNLDDIIKVVSECSGIVTKNILSKIRIGEWTNARHVAMYLMKENNAGITIVKIAAFFNVHHATVLAAIEKVKMMKITKDDLVCDLLAKCDNKIFKLK